MRFGAQSCLLFKVCLRGRGSSQADFNASYAGLTIALAQSMGFVIPPALFKCGRDVRLLKSFASFFCDGSR